jgi:hypothetical protein
MRICSAIFAAAVLAAATPIAGAGEDQPPPSPLRLKRDKPAFKRWGRVVFSDGKSRSGRLWTTPGKPIRIFDRKKSAYRDVKWNKIAQIEQKPDREWLEPEWRWKEGGSDVKVYTGRHYRAAKYRTTIRLKSGEKITGDAVAPIYLKEDRKLHRLELHKRFKSPKPAKKKDLEPLVYISKLVLTDKPPDNADTADGTKGKTDREPNDT